MNKAFLSALPLGFLFSLLIQKPSHAELRICNRDTGSRGINVAVAFHNRKPPGKAYIFPIVKGWFEVKPNNCSFVLGKGENVEDIVYIYAISHDKRKEWRGNKFFCIHSNNRFTVTGSTINNPPDNNDVRDCLKQGGNKLVKFIRFQVNKDGDTINVT